MAATARKSDSTEPAPTYRELFSIIDGGVFHVGIHDDLQRHPDPAFQGGSHIALLSRHVRAAGDSGQPFRIMKKTFLLFAATTVLSATLQAQVDYVDPAMGGQGFMLEPTKPTVSLPNSMVRVYPVRKDQLDDQISSFPLTIISHRLGELFWLMPGDGSPGAWNHAAAYDQEIETPYYYSTRFDDSLIQAEFTPTARCGYFRFTFPSGKPVVLLANRQGGDLSGND